jgi:hypothetical protein
MNLKLKIVRADTAEHSVLIRSFTDKVTEAMLAQRNPVTGDIDKMADGSPVATRTDLFVNLPVPMPTGDALNKWLLDNHGNHCRAWLGLQEKIADPGIDTAMAGIEAHVGRALDAPEPKIVSPDASAPLELRARREAGRQIGTTVL